MLYLLTILLSALSLLAPSAAFAEHFLQTKLIKQPNGHKDFGSHKGNLFVEAYHTGAGLNDAVLIPSPNTASKFFLNGTTGQFDLNSPSISWFLAMGGDANYAGEGTLHASSRLQRRSCYQSSDLDMYDVQRLTRVRD